MSSCAAAMSTERAPLSEQTRVDAAGGEMAERERERAHHAQPVRELGDLRRVARDQRRARRLQAEDVDHVLGPDCAEPLAVQPGAFAAAREPLLAGAEVEDVAEEARRPCARPTRVRSRARRRGRRASRSRSRRSDRRRRRSRPCRDIRPLPRRWSRRDPGSGRRSRPRPPGRSRSCRRRRGPRRRPAPARRAWAARPVRAARLRPRLDTWRASRSQRQEEQARGELRQKKVLFCGMTSPRPATAQTSSIRVGRSRNAAAASPRSTAETASCVYGVYVTPSGASRSTSSGSSPSPSSSS